MWPGGTPDYPRKGFGVRKQGRPYFFDFQIRNRQNRWNSVTYIFTPNIHEITDFVRPFVVPDRCFPEGGAPCTVGKSMRTEIKSQCSRVCVLRVWRGNSGRPWRHDGNKNGFMIGDRRRVRIIIVIVVIACNRGLLRPDAARGSGSRAV